MSYLLTLYTVFGQPPTVLIAGLVTAGLAVLAGRLLLKPSVRPEPVGPVGLIMRGWQGERRAGLRRVVIGAEAELADSDEEAPVRVRVADLSSGGLCLLMPSSLRPGKSLRVRPMRGGKTLPWNPIRVCSSCCDSDGRALHCRFEKPLPMHVLLLFG
jgi:PilZ domain